MIDLLGAGKPAGILPGCGLTQDFNDLTVIDPNLYFPGAGPPNIGPIGEELSRHCARDTNVNGGSVVGGSLSSAQSTRTVSQFNSRRSTQAKNKKQPPTVPNLVAEFESGMAISEVPGLATLVDSNSTGTESAIRFSDEKISLFSGVKFERLERSATRFEGAAEASSIDVYAGVAYRLSESLSVGFQGTYSNTQQTVFGNKTIDTSSLLQVGAFVPAPPFLTGSHTVGYQDWCGVSPDGESETNEAEGSLFALQRFSDSGFITGELGARRSSNSYKRSVCEFTVALLTGPLGNDVYFPNMISSGRLNGSPDSFTVNGKIRGGYDFSMGGLTFGPRVGLDVSRTDIGSFSETETPGAPSAFGTVHGQFASGAALHFDDQNIESVQSRLGFALSKEFLTGETLLTPYMEFNYVHEFANDQRNIDVTFVQDGRANPLKFSFKNNAPDRDFFELGGGILGQISDSTNFFATGKVILANELYDGFDIAGGFSIDF